jgi:cholestenol delta-isomerase
VSPPPRVFWPTPGHTSPQDFVFFDYFRRATAPTTDAFIDSSFWSQDLLQLAHAEPAMWHATLALGTLNRRWSLDTPGGESEALTLRARNHYGKAMALAKDLDSPSKVLALSLALVGSANMLGHWSEAHTHLLSALRMLAQNTKSRDEAENLALTLTRLEMQSLTLNDSCSPYPSTIAASIPSRDEELGTSGTPFESYAQAAAVLFALVRQCMLSQINLGHYLDMVKFESTMTRLLKDVSLFERRIDEFEARQQQPSDTTSAVTLRIYHMWLRLSLEMRCGPEQQFDECLGKLQRIVTLSYNFVQMTKTKDHLQLSLEPAIIAPLFDVARRCRHPALRRHTLSLLKNMNRHEGMWRSDAAAEAIEIVRSMEEEGELGQVYEEFASTFDNHCAKQSTLDEALGVPWTAWSTTGYQPPTNYTWGDLPRVPEGKRVREALVVIRLEERELDLRFLMGSDDPEYPFGGVKDATIQF